MHIKLDNNQYFLECSTGGYLMVKMPEDIQPPDSFLDKVTPLTRRPYSESWAKCTFANGDILKLEAQAWTGYPTTSSIDYSRDYMCHEMWLKLIRRGLYPKDDSDPTQIALMAWDKRRTAIAQINAEFAGAMTAIGGKKYRQGYDEVFWSVPGCALAFDVD